MERNKRIAILGLGWLGEPLAKHLSNQGYDVNGSTTSVSKLHRLSKLPYYSSRIIVEQDRIVGDWDSFMDGVKVLFINFPPKRREDIQDFYKGQIDLIVKNVASEVKVVFVSSTSVYGEEEPVVSEKTTCKPTKPSGIALVEAEQSLRKHFGKNLTVLRLAGLIGPKRHPGRFLANKKDLKQADAGVNLIHQEDCITLIEKIITQDFYGEIVNGCSDEHPSRRAFYTQAAIGLGLEPPVFSTEEQKPSKIVDNSYSKSSLGMVYKYANPAEVFNKENSASVSIVGVGPGDVNLLTLQALKRIEDADVLLYDNLVSPAILSLNELAEKIYVGRKYGDSTPQMTRQESINLLLLSNYRNGKKVARLKSGDPYIYGRGSEEAIFLKKHEVPFQMIPGITAALAAANTHNIPVTQRGKSNAVLICTGHLAEDSLDQLNSAAMLLKEGNSVALYMASKKIHDITEKLIELTGSRDIPVCAVSSVSTPDESMLSSTLGEVEEEIKKQALPLPVVFLIGHNPIT